MTEADRHFKETCKRILEEGYSSEGTGVRTRWEDGSEANYISIVGVQNVYDVGKEFPMIMQSGVSPSFSCSLIQRSNPVPHRDAHKRSESIRTPYTGQKPTLRSSSPSTTKHTSLRSRKSANCMVVPQKICASPESKQTLFKRSTAKSRNNTKTKLSSGTTT